VSKLAPLSVPYRVFRRGTSLLVALAFAAISGMPGLPVGPASLVALGFLAVAVAALGSYELAYYRRFEYELGAETLDIRSGVLARREREIPLGRVQNVDISRNVVERLLGLAVVGFETAGGGDTEATLRYVDFEEAKRLQREVARLKRGATATTDEVTDAPDAETLFEITDRELAILGALSFDFRIPGVLFVLLSGSAPVVSSLVPALNPAERPPVEVAGLLVAAGATVLAVSWLTGATVAVLNYHGFRLSRVGDELQYERGLLRRFDGSIPLEKIQSLTVEDSPLKRRFGYAVLRIETAGYAGAGDGGGGAATAVPLATRERVYELANGIEPFGAPDFERPPTRARQRYLVRYLLALVAPVALVAAAVRFAPLPSAALAATADLPRYVAFAPLLAVPVLAVAAHLKWRHRGYWLGPNHVVTRNGVWTRRVIVVPYYRIQTVIDSRTVFQRRRRLATVTVDTAGSLSILGSDAAAVDVDETAADALRTTLDERLVRALSERRGRRRQRRLRELSEGEAVDPAGAAGGGDVDEEADAAADGPVVDDGGDRDPDDAGAAGDDARGGPADGGFRFGDAVDPNRDPDPSGGPADVDADRDPDPGGGPADVDPNDDPESQSGSGRSE
jgi:putative membrane protein